MQSFGSQELAVYQILKYLQIAKWSKTCWQRVSIIGEQRWVKYKNYILLKIMRPVSYFDSRFLEKNLFNEWVIAKRLERPCSDLLCFDSIRLIPWKVKPSLTKSSQVMVKSKCGMWLDYDVSRKSNLKRRVEVLERGLDICSKSWFALEKWLNGQRQQPGRMQLRHDKSRTARWRENPHRDKNTIKII